MKSSIAPYTRRLTVAALPLMVTGLAGLAFVLRRKRMSLAAQSRAFFMLVVFVVGALAAAEGAKSATLVDTGTPADPNSPVAVFSKNATFAAQFTLSGNHTINSVEIFFETRFAGDATLKILNNLSNIPASTVFAQTFNFAVAPAQFVPFSGLSVNLGTGTYWIALFGLDTFAGVALTQPPNPAPFYAFTIDRVNWSTDTAARFAFRVTGDEVAQTPLPAALPLFTSGLGVLGLLAWGREKKVAALAA